MADAPDPAKRAQELIDALWADGKVGASVRSKAKEMFPDIVLPEDSMAPALDPLRAELGETRDELAKLRKERDEERAANEEAATRRTLEQSLDAARSRFHLTDDGFDKMVARMKETGNYQDAEAAAAWVAQQTPPASAPKAAWLPKKIDLFGSSNERAEEDFKQLHRDPLGYQDAQLQAFVNDPDRYVRETFAA